MHVSTYMYKYMYACTLVKQPSLPSKKSGRNKLKDGHIYVHTLYSVGGGGQEGRRHFI